MGEWGRGFILQSIKLQESWISACERVVSALQAAPSVAWARICGNTWPQWCLAVTLGWWLQLEPVAVRVCQCWCARVRFKCDGRRHHVIVKAGRYYDLFISLPTFSLRTHTHTHTALTWECSRRLKQCHACHISCKRELSVLWSLHTPPRRRSLSTMTRVLTILYFILYIHFIHFSSTCFFHPTFGAAALIFKASPDPSACFLCILPLTGNLNKKGWGKMKPWPA